MDPNTFYNASYQGSKEFNQWDVPTANATGFGAAADDYMERGIDLNEQLVKNKPATFFMRVSGDAMIGAGIHDGDVVVVDRSLKAVSGKVVIAILNGEMLIRRLDKAFNKIRLIPETPGLAPIEVEPLAEFAVWGVVTYVIHRV
ncbi:translesion error-prone DNA polymerase V autoproteolytic subunit [Chitinophagaceae bacterium 26-R-25]|nr:translesion error-prone DNA polymerase V autoproteolytic subunit [Chitinophagaceae bacterium 26-R-25]